MGCIHNEQDICFVCAGERETLIPAPPLPAPEPSWAEQIAALLDLVAQEARTAALVEARAVFAQNAIAAWKGGQTERSDGITDAITDFDMKFPEARPKW